MKHPPSPFKWRHFEPSLILLCVRRFHDAAADKVPEVQRPQVFYRREPEAKPLVIANTSEQGAGP